MKDVAELAIEIKLGGIMNNKKMICVIALLIFSAGCAHYENDLVQEGKAAVEIVPSKVMVKISDVHVLRKENEVKVMGYIERTGLGIMNGHVDIAILSSEKAILKLASAEYSPRFQRRSVRRRAVRPSSFSAKFPDSLPMGSIVKVVFHPDKIGNVVNCASLLRLTITSEIR